MQGERLFPNKFSIPFEEPFDPLNKKLIDVFSPRFVVLPKICEAKYLEWEDFSNEKNSENPFCTCSVQEDVETCPCSCHVHNFLQTMQLWISLPGEDCIIDKKMLASKIFYWITHVPLEEDFWTQIRVAQVIWSDFENREFHRKLREARLEKNMPSLERLHRYCPRPKFGDRQTMLNVDLIESKQPFEKWRPTARVCLSSGASELQEDLTFHGIAERTITMWTQKDDGNPPVLVVADYKIKGTLYIDLDILPDALQCLPEERVEEWCLVGHFAVDFKNQEEARNIHKYPYCIIEVFRGGPFRRTQMYLELKLYADDDGNVVALQVQSAFSYIELVVKSKSTLLKADKQLFAQHPSFLPVMQTDKLFLQTKIFNQLNNQISHKQEPPRGCSLCMGPLKNCLEEISQAQKWVEANSFEDKLLIGNCLSRALVYLEDYVAYVTVHFWKKEDSCSADEYQASIATFWYIHNSIWTLALSASDLLLTSPVPENIWRDFDKQRLHFGRFLNSHPRQCLFIPFGTKDDHEYKEIQSDADMRELYADAECFFDK